MTDDLTRWRQKELTGDDTVEVRVHSDGAVMWHRKGCEFGGREGALALGTVTDVPYSAFQAAFELEQTHQARSVLFCGGCLVYQHSG